MQQRNAERNLGDLRDLTEALARAAHDSGRPMAAIAEQLGVRRGYLAEALNPEHDELQFQARHLVAFCRACGVLPLAYIADQLGYVLVPRATVTTADTLRDEVLDVQAAVGKLAERVREASHDGIICAIDRSDIRDSARRVQREAAEVERAVSDTLTAQARRFA